MVNLHANHKAGQDDLSNQDTKTGEVLPLAKLAGLVCNHPDPCHLALFPRPSVDVVHAVVLGGRTARREAHYYIA